MKKMNFLILVFSLIKIISLEEIVIFAFQMNRNGARSPSSGVKNGQDLFLENWKENDEISSIGKRQLYLLGVKARKRYIEKFNLLSNEYNQSQIYIMSTNSNKTIEGIYSFIQGLYSNGNGKKINEKVSKNINITYPPNKNEKYKNLFKEILKNYSINDGISALPYGMNILPIHSISNPDIQIELYDSKNCKGYKELFENKELDEYSKKLVGDDLETFKKLEENYTNQKIKENDFLNKYSTLYRYMDNLVCDFTDKRNFNKFGNQYNYTKDLSILKETSNEFIKNNYIKNSNYKNKSLVEMSDTMIKILNWMNISIEIFNETKVIKNSKYIKYVVYSVDDSTFGALDGFMNYVFNSSSIEYSVFAESRYFELFYNTNDGQYNVRYLKGDNNQKYDTTFQNFKDSIYKKYWPNKNISKFCEPEKNYNIDLVAAGFMVLISVINGVLLVLLVLYCSNRK